MAITCVSSLNQVVRKKTHSRPVKQFKLTKNNNNLVCPKCGVHLDRKDVKIWFDYNYGECPGCFHKVHFDSINSRGPRGGREYYESIQTVVNCDSVKIDFLEAHLRNLEGVTDPLSYLKVEEIVKFSNEDPEIVKIRCHNKWPIGRPSKEFQKNREKVLTFLN